MNTKELTYLLQNPTELKKGHTPAIEKLVREFPYFQSVRSLGLKGLKDQESFRYNQELKTTAAYTADRNVLFDFITSPFFTETPEQKEIKKKTKTDIEVFEAKEIKTLPRMSMDDAVTMKMEEAEDVLDPSLFANRKEESIFRHVTISESLNKQSETVSGSEETAPEETPKTVIQVDKPLDFDKKEAHSFAEWLKLTSLQPIVRNTEDTSNTIDTEAEEENIKKQETPSPNKHKFDLIDQFIATNPKIQPASRTGSSRNLAKKNMTAPDELMTETLARVYLAQKNYKKAIQAYKILILKNPEKSGFFADQIRAIENLQENK